MYTKVRNGLISALDKLCVDTGSFGQASLGCLVIYCLTGRHLFPLTYLSAETLPSLSLFIVRPIVKTNVCGGYFGKQKLLEEVTQKLAVSFKCRS